MSTLTDHVRQLEGDIDAFYNAATHSPNGGTVAKIGALVGLSTGVVFGAMGIHSIFQPEAYGNPDTATPPAAVRQIEDPAVGLAPNGSPIEAHNTSTIPYEDQPAASRQLGIHEVPGSIETRRTLFFSALGGIASSLVIAIAPYAGRREEQAG